ncbi:hypothetical protein BH11PSE11_BH11PSE11_34190 [soil metagenome]
MLALREEVSRLDEIGKSCGDDWAEDFDPNDIGMFESMQKSLEEADLNWGVRQGIEMLDGGSSRPYTYLALMGKTVRFTMALVPDYVRRYINQISETDYNLLFNFYCEFNLRHCLGLISNTREHLNDAAVAQNLKGWASDAILKIEQFPTRE